MVRRMLQVATTATATVLSTLLVLSSHHYHQVVDAHGLITQPKVEFNEGVMPTTYVTTFYASFEGKFDDNPQANVDNFSKAFKAQSQYKTLRDLIHDKGPECGNSNPNVSPKPIPADSVIVFQNPDTGEGFVPSHTGPCEVWLDDQRVFADDNCAGHFPEQPAAHLPIDFSSCTNNCMLKFYWLALHEPNWQVYKNCIPLIGTGGNYHNNNNNGGGDYNAPSPTMAPAPAPAPASNEYSQNFAVPPNGNQETFVPATAQPAEYNDEDGDDGSSSGPCWWDSEEEPYR